MAKRYKDYTIGILIGVIVILVIISVAWNFTSNSNSEGELFDYDFQIVSLSWDTQYKSYQFGDGKIDWDTLCESGHSDYKSISYTITTRQNYDLACDYNINGKTQWTDPSGNVRSLSGYYIDKDDGKHEGVMNLDFTQDNEITMCCKKQIMGTNEICKSATLLAKCNL